MSRIVFTCLIMATTALGADNVDREITYLGVPACGSDNCPVLRIDHGYLLGMGDPHYGPPVRISVWNPTGKSCIPD
jgi:hypothetical protein